MFLCLKMEFYTDVTLPGLLLLITKGSLESGIRRSMLQITCFVKVPVRKSSKRRLILVSPFEHKSEAELLKRTDFRELCSLPRAKKNVLDYYRSSEIVKDGSGDENVTIIQSPAKGTTDS